MQLLQSAAILAVVFVVELDIQSDKFWFLFVALICIVDSILNRLDAGYSGLLCFNDSLLGCRDEFIVDEIWLVV